VSEIPLKAGQQKVAEGFFNWLFRTDQPELCISGPGGVGKTFMMGHFIDSTIPKYVDMCKMMGIDPLYDMVDMTATTNKAAEILGRSTKRHTQTLQSLLKLGVWNDYRTGKSKLVKKRDAGYHYRKVIFVDESSMMGTELRAFLKELAPGCKIVYVGDDCQLAPIGEDISPIYKDNLPFYELTEPVRNADQPALMDVCQQLRQTVKDVHALGKNASKVPGLFKPIQLVPGVIDHMGSQEMLQEIRKTFMDPANQERILCYQNDKVIKLNQFIRKMRGMPADLTVGECVVNNSAILNTKYVLSVEEEFQLLEIQPPTKHQITPQVSMDVKLCTIKGEHGTYTEIPVPADMTYFNSLLAYFQKIGKATKDFSVYYQLKETYPDLRPRDAATVHKSQGSTYNTTFIDLSDLSECFDLNTVARLLYVAFSRAKHRVMLFGELKDKYGGLKR
jgi:hypothetical protein